MSLHRDLLNQAKHLARLEPRRPRQASLRRAVSASYYALYHLLVSQATARMFHGKSRAPLRHRVARAFAHSVMKEVAGQFAGNSVSPRLSPGLNGQPLQPKIVQIAGSFIALQEARHDADYDTARRFKRAETLSLVRTAERAFSDWDHVKETDQADTFLAGLLTYRNMQA